MLRFFYDELCGSGGGTVDRAVLRRGYPFISLPNHDCGMREKKKPICFQTGFFSNVSHRPQRRIDPV